MRHIKIGKPCTPSRIVDQSVYDATKVLVSYGGGMGGASQTFYTKNILHGDDEIMFKDIENRELTINKRFVVLQEPVRLAMSITDTTNHSNYHKKTVRKSQLIEYRVLYPNDTYEFVDEYVSSGHGSDNEKSIVLKQRSEVEL